jgi:hypothetical protein
MQWLIVIAVLGGSPVQVPAPAAMAAAQPGGGGDILPVTAAIVPIAATFLTGVETVAVMSGGDGGHTTGGAAAPTPPADMAVPRRLFESAADCEQAAGAIALAPGSRLVCLPVEAAAPATMPTAY